MTPNERRSRDERLRDILSTAAGICYGMGGYDARLVEFGSGFPAGSGGGGSKGTVSRPVERMALESWEESLKPKTERKEDPVHKAQAEFNKRLEAAHRAMEALWDSYAEVATPRAGVSKVTDPGCELCAQVPDHWCPTFATVKRTNPPKRKGQEPVVVKLRLCDWCHQFARPDRADRLPEHDDLVKHSRGQRVRWKVGA